MNYKIITDSSCELSSDIVNELDIDVLPVIIMLDDRQFLDNIDIVSKTVFEGMERGDVYKTAQIKLNTYVEKFSDYAKKNIPIINIVMSSGISSSYETSKMAVNMVKEEYPDAIIHTLDSKCCSYQMGIAVRYMAMAAKNGKSFEEIVDILKYCRKNISVYFSVSDLKYLQRGGRISKASAMIGNALSIKPVLSVDEDGKIYVTEKVRSKKKVISYITDKIKTEVQEEYKKDTMLYITGAKADDIIDELKKQIMENISFRQEQFFIQETGATIGVHTGPYSIYIFYLKKPVPESMYR